MPLKIVRNDITKMRVDAIVNTANEFPAYAEGTDRAVYKAAGEAQLLEARRNIGVLPEGEVAVTPGFQLPARYIFHAVSPYYGGEESEVEEKLRGCYRKSLALAKELNCKSIAFPLIATGSYGYPKEEGMRIALDEINTFLLTHEMLVYLVVFDEATTNLGKRMYPDLEAYIDRHYVEEKEEEEYFGLAKLSKMERPRARRAENLCMQESKRVRKHIGRLFAKASAPMEESVAYKEDSYEKDSCESASCELDYDAFIEESEAAIKDRLRHLSDTAHEYLLCLSEAKGLTNADVYKRALLTKQLFSKIKLNPEYHPDKVTAMRLCVGATLNLDETKDLLARAGYALSPSEKRDVIFSYFIEKGVYDMIEIDIALEEHGAECFIA